MRKVLGIGAAVLCSLVVLFTGCSYASSPSAPSTPSAPPIVLDKIEITKQPEKIEYHIGDEIDLTGMVVTAIYNDGFTKPLASNEYTVTGFDSTAAVESQPITVTYGEKTAIFIVKITSVLLIGIEITNPPNKKEYFVGAAQIDLTDLKVTATYTDGSTADVTDKVTTSGFDSSTAIESQTITVTYGGKTATFIVKIVKTNVTSITIETQPSKKEYFVGAAQLDLTDLKVTATYTDGSTADVTDKVTTSGFDSSTATESQTITLTYEGKTATFTVKINPVLLTGISITNQPTKKAYFIGEDLDKAGMKVTATYTDGSTADVTDKVTTSGFDSSIATESQTITVTYEGKTATFTINVVFNWYETPVQLPASIGGTYGTEVTYVLFGVWPQDVVRKEDEAGLALDETAATTIERGNFKYVKGSDGNYYVKCAENAYKSGYKYNKDNSDVGKGGTTSRWFKVMPIKWRVVDSAYKDASGSLQGKLLVAENILTANVPYYESINNHRNGTYPNNYMHSQIRAYLNGINYNAANSADENKWLNKGFLQTAFGTTAQQTIQTTEVDNSGKSTTDVGKNLYWANGKKADGVTDSGYDDYTCGNTKDKIFLLSEYEVTKYSKSTEKYDSYGKGNSRIRVTTDFAKANKAYQDTTAEGYGGYWWLRSPVYGYSGYAYSVRYDGKADYNYSVSYTEVGVVPALLISF